MEDAETPEQRWVRIWKQAAPELEVIRRREIAEADNAQVLAALAPAFEYALRTTPLRTTSGMVEMQRLFQKLRK